jgi:hypothetical protein
MTGKKLKERKAAAIVFIGLLSIPFVPILSATTVSSDKPLTATVDLVIKNMGFYEGYKDGCWELNAYAVVENLGDSNVTMPIELTWTIQRLTTQKIVASGTVYFTDTMPSGGWAEQELTHARHLPNFGLFIMTCEVNPNHTINETNYDNNIHSGLFLSLFGTWFPKIMEPHAI